MGNERSGQYAGRRITVYCKTSEQLDRLRQLAAKDGMPNKLSSWILQNALKGASGDQELLLHVEELKSENERLRERYERERDATETYRSDLRAKDSELRALSSKLEEYAEKFAQIAARAI